MSASTPTPPNLGEKTMSEPFFTIKEAATLLRIPYWKLNRAVNQGLIPSHSMLNQRKYLKLSEVENCMAQHGGDYVQ